MTRLITLIASGLYEPEGENVIVELIAYGPGLNMFVAEKSPVANGSKRWR